MSRKPKKKSNNRRNVPRGIPCSDSRYQANGTFGDEKKENSTKQIMYQPTEERITYLESLVAKQLNLYNWCEEKVSTLATIDSVLFGGATLLLDKIIRIEANTDVRDRIIQGLLALMVLFPLFLSLVIALWHIRPKMGKASNTGIPNHRSANGIRHFKNADEYTKGLYKMSNSRISDDLAKQIYGMNNNIWKSQKSIKLAVLLDIIAVVFFLIMVCYWLYSIGIPFPI